MKPIPISLPAGTILPFAGINIPDGFMLCDGRALSRAAYAGLFQAIGTAHGAPDVNQFNIPDYRGRFLRGVDFTAGLDPDKATRTAMKPGGATGNALGSVQGDQIRAHNHTYQFNQTAVGSRTEPALQTSGNGGNSQTTNNTGGNETRPVNAYVNFIIKT
ncbi:hypothetical protein AZI87_11980 [Bdellovibrio bacteriovorus]|uniref:Phage tail collar domain-containing protein n=1 Tax=Bdellovibrio bacteriovorus TaxID=959 RepID=A0A162G8C3_BDEBC|nr:tail fiber protein [Bdellovibrio bacteriovorus]KYG65267.1 hypothetical protein AZI87_11980 [Bdellovibrio bacteriovorus]